MSLTIRRTEENEAVVSKLFSDYIATAISAVEVAGSFKVRTNSDGVRRVGWAALTVTAGHTACRCLWASQVELGFPRHPEGPATTAFGLLLPYVTCMLAVRAFASTNAPPC